MAETSVDSMQQRRFETLASLSEASSMSPHPQAGLGSRFTVAASGVVEAFSRSPLPGRGRNR